MNDSSICWGGSEKYKTIGIGFNSTSNGCVDWKAAWNPFVSIIRENHLSYPIEFQ